MDAKSFIQLIRGSKEFYMLILRRPTAFVLLALIAQRAKRSKDHPYPELDMGEALIGDYETYGVTEQMYRTDKHYLTKLNFATFRATNRGTIAKLMNSCVFDINIEGEKQPNQRTNQQAVNDQPTTNNNDKKEKKGSPFQKSQEEYTTEEAKQFNDEQLLTLIGNWTDVGADEVLLNEASSRGLL